MSELDAYDFDLPPELIAQQPLPQRGDARLMIVNRRAQTITHAHVRDLPETLLAGDCLVLNETRVTPARLLGRRELSGGRWEGLFLSADGQGCWRLLCKTRGKLAPGESIVVAQENGQDAFTLRLLLKEPDGVWIARAETDEETFSLLERVGRVPLPHYIRHGEMLEDDRTWYQTVYARRPGSVAAPTAGLHFTAPLLKNLEARGVSQARVTLHVGLGTFRPIAVDKLSEHAMHSEWGEVDAEAVSSIEQAKAAGGRVVAVGTTTTRLLETAAREGLKPWSGETDLFIKPPYQFRAIDALMTNFHFPRSTLLVLVRTFGGDALIRQAYEEAIREEYRFFSYGDAMLIV